jgi:hypothetical protein
MRVMRTYLHGTRETRAEFYFDDAMDQFIEVQKGRPMRSARGFSKETLETLDETVLLCSYRAAGLLVCPVTLAVARREWERCCTFHEFPPTNSRLTP